MDHKMLEKVAHKHGVWVEDVYEELFNAIDVAEVETAANDIAREKLTQLLRWLFRLRLSNQIGFDAFALKHLFPHLTHAEIVKILSCLRDVKYSGRQRSSEIFKHLLSDHPELMDVVSFDRRGGARQRPKAGGKS